MITGLADWADLPDRLEVVAALAHGEVSLPLFRLCRATARALDAVVADPAPRRDRVPGKVPRAVRVSGLVADVTQQELASSSAPSLVLQTLHRVQWWQSHPFRTYGSPEADGTQYSTRVLACSSYRFPVTSTEAFPDQLWVCRHRLQIRRVAEARHVKRAGASAARQVWHGACAHMPRGTSVVPHNLPLQRLTKTKTSKELPIATRMSAAASHALDPNPHNNPPNHRQPSSGTSLQ